MAHGSWPHVAHGSLAQKKRLMAHASLMALNHGSWLMAHGSMAHGSWLMAHGS
jgi:hypothetical protein